jgi:hypothetical protein
MALVRRWHMELVEVNGKKIEDGETVMVDHSVQTFTVQIRTMNGLPVETLKDYLQRKYEVVNITETKATTYVHGSSLPDLAS